VTLSFGIHLGGVSRGIRFGWGLGQAQQFLFAGRLVCSESAIYIREWLWVVSCMWRLMVTRCTAMESVRDGGPTWSDMVQHDLRVRRKLGELLVGKRGSPVRQQELYLWELGRALTTNGLRGRSWGDEQLRALLELARVCQRDWVGLGSMRYSSHNSSAFGCKQFYAVVPINQNDWCQRVSLQTNQCIHHP
jgi:hypothetical protein